MKRKRFICYWRGANNIQYVNLEITHHKITDGILEVFDGDMQVGGFDLGFIELWYITEG